MLSGGGCSGGGGGGGRSGGLGGGDGAGDSEEDDGEGGDVKGHLGGWEGLALQHSLKGIGGGAAEEMRERRAAGGEKGDLKARVYIGGKTEARGSVRAGSR